MTEQDRINIEAVRRMYMGDESERAEIAKDIIWHVPGHNPVSGDYHGYEEYTQLMPSRMAPLDEWEFALHDVMVNGDFVMATFSMKGTRRGVHVELRGGHLMRVRAGKVVEGWGFTHDQDALDRFFSA